jgi:hypothetical protein
LSTEPPEVEGVELLLPPAGYPSRELMTLDDVKRCRLRTTDLGLLLTLLLVLLGLLIPGVSEAKILLLLLLLLSLVDVFMCIRSASWLGLLLLLLLLFVLLLLLLLLLFKSREPALLSDVDIFVVFDDVEARGGIVLYFCLVGWRGQVSLRPLGSTGVNLRKQ